MRKTLAILATVAVALVVAFGPSADRAAYADERQDALRQTLGDDEFRACGLDQLTSEQSDRLFRQFRPASSHSYLSESAQRFLEANGWRRIEVLGLREIPTITSPDRYVVISDNYDILFLDPWAGDDNLPTPGVYWAKNSLSSWEILMPDGHDRDFQARDLD